MTFRTEDVIDKLHEAEVLTSHGKIEFFAIIVRQTQQKTGALWAPV